MLAGPLERREQREKYALPSFLGEDVRGTCLKAGSPACKGAGIGGVHSGRATADNACKGHAPHGPRAAPGVQRPPKGADRIRKLDQAGAPLANCMSRKSSSVVCIRESHYA